MICIKICLNYCGNVLERNENKLIYRINKIVELNVYFSLLVILWRVIGLDDRVLWFPFMGIFMIEYI